LGTFFFILGSAKLIFDLTSKNSCKSLFLAIFDGQLLSSPSILALILLSTLDLTQSWLSLLLMLSQLLYLFWPTIVQCTSYGMQLLHQRSSISYLDNR